MTPTCYLFYIAHNYSFEILRPLQQVILAQGDEVKWLAVGKEVTLSYFQDNESVLASIDEARSYNPAASFAPGNEIPNFIPGLKVQVFHGLEWKKKGHFVIRDFFDLYCTHGPATTSRFNLLAKQHGFLMWLKLAGQNLITYSPHQQCQFVSNYTPKIKKSSYTRQHFPQR